MELARTELQITTDVATRAAGRMLSVTGSEQQAILAAERLMQANPFANQTMSLSGSNIVFGVSTRTAANQPYTFKPGKNPNAVQIQANGQVKVPMLFPTMGLPINFRPIKTAICTQSELDLALVIDRSGSMAYGVNEIADGSMPAGAPLFWNFGQSVPLLSRWLDAVSAVDTFLDLLNKSTSSERVSLTTYGDSAQLEVNLSSNYFNIKSALFNHTLAFHGGATNIGGGIQAGIKSLADAKLARPWASRVMVVLTDGIHNTGTDPLSAATQAAAEDIMIFTITFSNEADKAKMLQVAEVASGNHFHAVSADQLNAAFKEIANRLPNLLTY